MSFNVYNHQNINQTLNLSSHHLLTGLGFLIGLS